MLATQRLFVAINALFDVASVHLIKTFALSLWLYEVEEKAEQAADRRTCRCGFKTATGWVWCTQRLRGLFELFVYFVYLAIMIRCIYFCLQKSNSFFVVTESTHWTHSANYYFTEVDILSFCRFSALGLVVIYKLLRYFCQTTWITTKNPDELIPSFNNLIIKLHT